MRRRKKCLCCKELYHPHPQSYRQQKTCTKAACRSWRRRQACGGWWRKHPLYGESRRMKLVAWRKENKDYWKRWRKEHLGYVLRNRKAQRKRNSRKRQWIAKQNDWNSVCMEKLTRIRSLRLIAKQNDSTEVLSRQIDGLCLYLRGHLLIAKQNNIDRSP
jgi:hypothetical protein